MPETGDVDLAAVGTLLGDRARTRMLLALGDGRALPASRLASEAGVSAPTASSHLGKLVGAGLLRVEPHGRHRYYRLAGREVGRLLEAMTALAPPAPVRSLREGTRARALREARTCYDHLAGRLGVGLMGSLIERGHLVGGDGRFEPGRADRDRLSAYGRDVDYVLSDSGRDLLCDLGVTVPSGPSAIRYCVDWSEQRHHLSGRLGRALLTRLLELDWVRRAPGTRAVTVTELGRDTLPRAFPGVLA
ncbi:MAG TPA: winged helix-turn-helix domain-containing protein [Solirubrobacteraceae bacterium]|nr:winged helix-turn-helix domain-containing protein [Solirubrobacteraceae bacterium]